MLGRYAGHHDPKEVVRSHPPGVEGACISAHAWPSGSVGVQDRPAASTLVVDVDLLFADFLW